MSLALVCDACGLPHPYVETTGSMWGSMDPFAYKAQKAPEIISLVERSDAAPRHFCDAACVELWFRQQQATS